MKYQKQIPNGLQNGNSATLFMKMKGTVNISSNFWERPAPGFS